MVFRERPKAKRRRHRHVELVRFQTRLSRFRHRDAGRAEKESRHCRSGRYRHHSRLHRFRRRPKKIAQAETRRFVSARYALSISKPVNFFTRQRWAATAEFPIPTK